MKAIAITAAVVAQMGGTAFAEEQPIQLKDAPGHDVVEQNCGVCHSLDYIKMNSPFLKADEWNAVVTKMINTYGAPIAEDDAKKIQDYLIRNYGG
jgi:cytochrome c5